MKSHRTYRAKNGGFTLIEILVAIGIFMVIAVMTVTMGMNSIGRSVVEEDRDLLVILLNDARANALANVNESRHGVHITSDGSQYTVFEGDDFATSDVSTHRDVERAESVTVSPLGGEVGFDRLSGDAYAGAGTVTLSQDALSLDININSIGRIEW